MSQKHTSKILKTKQDATVTLDLGDSNGNRQFTFADAQKLIHTYISATNFAQAASVSIQLADQLPQDPWPHLVAAESLYLHQQIGPALHYIDHALRIDPQNIASLVIKSRICLYSGKHEEARQLIDTAVSLAPQNAQLQFEKGELLSEVGDLDGSCTALLKSIELDPRKTNSLLSLSRLPGDNFPDTLIRKIESMIQTRQLPEEDQVKAHFSLAHAYDKKANVEMHFSHLIAGNDLKSQSIHFDPGGSSQETQNIIEFFSTDFFAQHSNVHGNPANIIFIVGFPRCGSTLVEHILSSHPSVSSAGEIFALNHSIRQLRQSRQLTTGHQFSIDGLPDHALNDIADDYLRRAEQFSQNTYMTDKQLNNYIHIGLIHLIFPNAKIISVERNPIAACYSCYKNLFHLSSVPYTYNLENLAHKYSEYRLMIRHWEKVLPGKIHTVEYENLINKQEDVTRNLLSHCELKWNEACLNFQRNTRTVLTSSSVQVRQPLYTDSIDHWKCHEKHLGPLLKLTND